MELHEALEQIAQIRQQMARTEVFRGYRSAATAFTGAVAVAAAAAQDWLAPDPVTQPGAYLALWLSAAGVSLAAVAAVVAWRYRRSDSPLQRQITVLAVEQFLPAVVAGGLLTCVLAACAPEAVWLLPGLWSLLLALGVFASQRVLPRATRWVGGYYLLAGLLILATGEPAKALSPWAMLGSFGVGQFLAAAVLFWTLERRDDLE